VKLSNLKEQVAEKMNESQTAPMGPAEAASDLLSA
jgi:hypothetical protein